MKELFDDLAVLSNRELSLVLWLLIVIVFVLISKSTRNSFLQLVKIFFSSAFIKVYLSLIIYLCPIVILFYRTEIWSSKDFVFWLVTVCFVLIFSFKTVDEPDFFRKKIFESFKIVVLFEFIINFHNFSLLVELILLPTIVFYALLMGYSENDKKYEKVYNCLLGLVVIIGLLYFLYSSYLTFTQWKYFYSKSTLLTFIFPIILTILFLPFLYGLTFFRKFESISLRLNYIIKSDQEFKKSQLALLKASRLNIQKLDNISRNLDSYKLNESARKLKYFKQISTKS